MSLDEVGLDKVSGIGPKYQLAFKKIGVQTIKDLIYFLPKRIIDLSIVEPVSSARVKINEDVVIEGKLKGLRVIRTKFKHMWIVEGLIEDATGGLEVVWYNQPFLYKNLKNFDGSLVFKGQVVQNKAKVVLNSPEIFPQKGIFPVYRQTKNLTSKIISKTVHKLLKPSLMPRDLLPGEIKKDFNLPDLLEASQYCHQPDSEKQFSKGRYRFLFEELFIFMLVNQKIRQEFENENSPKIKNKLSIEKLVSKLPYELTSDQAKTLMQILLDFKKPYPMNRIVQGDVGSGKTIVAFLAAIAVADSGYQVAFMAPTEILAIQHYKTFVVLKKTLGLNKVGIKLITSKTKKNDGKADIVVGTHALMNANFEKLGLVVVDEQQRFGVEQRNILLENQKFMPHYLSLSATPIPRSLAHVVFANCDLSQILEKPKNRLKIKTFLIPENKRQDTYNFVDQLIRKGEQAFIVCPLISNNGLVDDKRSVESELQGLKKTILSKHRIGSLHGKMKSQDKEKVIADFGGGKIDILVSTSVVEVGIDIKNASVMIIEDAQMFGLAQLHQIRGRVGRSDKQSYCFAFAKIEDNELTRNRMKAFVRSDDGFELSNYDLKLRGPGSFFNINQSGYSGINPLWFESSKLLSDCSKAAKSIIAMLDKYPALSEVVEGRIIIRHLD